MSATNTPSVHSTRASLRSAKDWVVRHASEHNASVNNAYETFYGTHMKPTADDYSPALNNVVKAVKKHVGASNAAYTTFYGVPSPKSS